MQTRKKRYCSNNICTYNNRVYLYKKNMKRVLHKANTRGMANHGWLNSYHSFSFAGYFNQDRMNFGALRVLNDDTVAPGMGFGTHPHQDMEIISIPLEGDLEHKDSMGNTAIIRSGDIQILSAGTGISHSEYNKNEDQSVKFLQIWILPNQKGVKPRYDQISLQEEDRKNKLQQILSPSPTDEGVMIHQNAWFYRSQLEKGKSVSYALKEQNKNGLYVFVLDGTIQIEDMTLSKRDAMGLWEAKKVVLKADSDSELLLIEVPMEA